MGSYRFECSSEWRFSINQAAAYLESKLKMTFILLSGRCGGQIAVAPRKILYLHFSELVMAKLSLQSSNLICYKVSADSDNLRDINRPDYIDLKTY